MSAINLGEPVMNDRVNSAIAEQNFRDASRRRVAGEGRGKVGHEDVADFGQFVPEGAREEHSVVPQLRSAVRISARRELQTPPDLFAER
jgi:hypothetical protein